MQRTMAAYSVAASLILALGVPAVQTLTTQRALANLSGVYVRCYQVSVVEAEQAELAARLERLEEGSNARRAF